MHFINKELNTVITIVEKDNEVFFDLKEVAVNLGYTRPDQAVYDFKRRNGHLLENDAAGVIGNNLAPEWVLYLFLLKSNAERALDFQIWVAKEVLPTVRKVGLQAIKELEVLQYLAQQPQNSGLVREDLPHEVSDEFLLSNGLHWLTGYSAPSSFNVSLIEFYRSAVELGYLNEEGELLKPEAAVHNPKYHNCHTPSGKWFAWSQQDGAAIALRAKSAQPVGLRVG